MSIPFERVPALRAFRQQRFITSIDLQLTSGKEATVYRCTAHPRLGRALVAAKVYTPLIARGFRNDALYQVGRIAPQLRQQGAMAAHSRYGQEVQQMLWQATEFKALTLLHAAGVDVPQPIATAEGAILMEYIGDATAPAPLLRQLRLGPAEVAAIVERLSFNIERMLSCHLVHGDLSPYNVLYWQGTIRIIDLPQAVDARQNGAAYDLLVRDWTNFATYCQRAGVTLAAREWSDQLWQRYQRGAL